MRRGESWVRILLLPAVLAAAACGAGGAAPGSDAEADAQTFDAIVGPTAFGPGFRDLSIPLDSPQPPPILLDPGNPTTSPLPTLMLCGDLDEDGAPEVILASAHEAWLEDARRVYTYVAETEALELRTDLSLPAGMPVGVEDLDGDGHADLLYASPTGAPWLAWGDGYGQFETADAPFELYYPGFTAVSLADMDFDGLVDVLVGDAVATPVLAAGGRRFERRPDLMSELGLTGTTAVLAAPFGGNPMVLMGFGGSDAGANLSFLVSGELDDAGFPHFQALVDALAVPNEISSELGLAAGQPLNLASPMGAAIGDVDGDGDFDLATPVDPTFNLLMWEGAWPLVDQGRASRIWEHPAPETGRAMLGWGTALLDLDLDGRADLVVAHGDDSTSWVTQSIGPQTIGAYWNAGEATFADVSAAVGLGQSGNWYGLTACDLDRDGRPDLGVGALGGIPRVLLNRIEVPGRALSVRLRGTASNPLGLGARVEVATADGARRHFVAGSIAAPQVISPPLIFAGLGPHDTADLTVHWPSGLVQQVPGVQAGRLHLIEEPQTVAIEPPTRHASAATGQVRILVSPHDGSESRPGAPVEVKLTHGQGTLIAPEDPAAHPQVWTLKAPPSPGSTRISITIDGRELAVFPRIWWD